MNAYNTQTNPSPASSYFDGKTIQHIGWNLLAFFLTVITAGIAYPWAMCMSMRWEVKHTVINGRRLKFTGNGAQLFGKYILWLFLTLITAGIYLIWLTISVAKWKAKHTVYEDDPDGESFFDGGVAGWFFQRLLVGFLTIITLGIYFAWGKKRLIAWVTKHTVICGDRLTFVGTGGEFFVRYLLYLLLTPLTLGIYALFFPVRMLKWQYSRTFVAQEEAPRYFAAPAAQTRTAPSGWGNPYAAQQQPQPQRKKLSAGAIIALVICGILALTLFAFVGYMIYLHANGIEFSWPWERVRVSTEELVPGVNIPVTEHSTVYISDNSGQPGSPESEYTRYMIVHDDGTTLVTGEGIISGLRDGACVVAVGEPSGGFQRILAIDGDGVLREGLYPLEKLERLLVGVTVEQLYVRSGPGMEYDILGTIDAGQRILVTGGELHGWYPVNCVVIEGGTVTGYSFGEYITFEGDFEAKEPWEGVTADASDPAPVYLVANSGQTVEPDPDPIEESRPEGEVSQDSSDQSYMFRFRLNDDGMSYTVEGFSSSFIDYSTDLYGFPAQDLVIPGTYNGLPVSGIEGFWLANGAMSDGNYVKSAHIPAEVTKLNAFNNLNIDITVDPGNPVYYVDGNCVIERATKKIIHGNTRSTIPADGSVTAIGDGAFCAIPNDLYIPATITEIAYGAFGSNHYSNHINSITVDKNNPVYYVKDKCLIEKTSKTLVYAFYGSTIPEDGSVTRIGSYSCSYLETEVLDFPEAVTYIGDEGFAYNWRISSVSFYDTVEYIGEYTFMDTFNLNEIIIIGNDDDNRLRDMIPEYLGYMIRVESR